MHETWHCYSHDLIVHMCHTWNEACHEHVNESIVRTTKHYKRWMRYSAMHLTRSIAHESTDPRCPNDHLQVNHKQGCRTTPWPVPTDHSCDHPTLQNVKDGDWVMTHISMTTHLGMSDHMSRRVMLMARWVPSERHMVRGYVRLHETRVHKWSRCLVMRDGCQVWYRTNLPRKSRRLV